MEGETGQGDSFGLSSNGDVLCIFVAGFHHGKGWEVEFCYPEECMTTLSKWPYLAALALPDGAHKYDHDTVYFHLPDDNGRTVYGVSCYRQADVNQITKTAEMTRNSVQKSICALVYKPLYGFIRSKLEVITHAYFVKGDLTDRTLLKDSFHSLEYSIRTSALDSAEIYADFNIRDLFVKYSSSLLVIFKSILLEKKILVFGSPAHTVASFILGIISLFPDLMSKGLCWAMHCPKRRPRQSTSSAVSTDSFIHIDNVTTTTTVEEPDSSSLKVPIKPAAPTTLDPAAASNAHDSGDEFQSTIADVAAVDDQSSPSQRKEIVRIETRSGAAIVEGGLVDGGGTKGLSKKESPGPAANRESSNQFILRSKVTNGEDLTDIFALQQEDEEEEELFTAADDACPFDGKERKMKLKLLGGGGASDDENLSTSDAAPEATSPLNHVSPPPPAATKADTAGAEYKRHSSGEGFVILSRRSDGTGEGQTGGEDDTKNMDFRDSWYDGPKNEMPTIKITDVIETDAYGLPLSVFTEGSLCQPYSCLHLMERFQDNATVKSFLVGATNRMFTTKAAFKADLIVEPFEEECQCQMTFRDLEMKKDVTLTTADLRFIDYIKRVVDSSGSNEPHGGGGTHNSTDSHFDNTSWSGSDEWIRNQFTTYLISLLTTIDHNQYDLVEDYRGSFVQAWQSTQNFRVWSIGCPYQSLKELNPGHPFRGQYSATNDLRLKVQHTLQSTDRGRRVNTAMQNTGRYLSSSVQQTSKAVTQGSKAVHGALSQARGAVSSWWKSTANWKQRSRSSSPSNRVEGGSSGVTNSPPDPNYPSNSCSGDHSNNLAATAGTASVIESESSDTHTVTDTPSGT